MDPAGQSFTMSSSQSLSTPHQAPRPIRWRSWPLQTHPVVGLLLVAALAAAGLGILEWTDRAYLAGLAVAALLIGFWRFFVPVAFELNADGVHQRILGRHGQIAWRSIQRYEIFADGILLLPFADRAGLDALRGLYLPWGAHRDEVLACVQQYLPGAAQSAFGS
jgi:hypothetical protein